MDRRTLLFVLALTLSLFFVNQWFGGSKTEHKTPPVSQEFVPDTSPLPLDQAPTHTPLSEQLYVLENRYQQLVFSNMGGALAELNLPLQSPNDPHSPIRPISFDRIMEKEYPYNDYFPAAPYQIVANEKPVSHPTGVIGGYYPLLRRGIKTPGGDVAVQLPSQFYAMNISAQDGSLDNQLFQVTRFEKNLIQFELQQPQRRIVKTFSFAQDLDRAPYCIDVTIRIEGDARNLSVHTGAPEVELISESFSPSLKFRQITSNPQKRQVEQISLPKNTDTVSMAATDWVSNSNGFFGLILDPVTELPYGFRARAIPGGQIPTRLTIIDAHHQLYPAVKYPAYDIFLPLSAKTMQFRLYAGPLEDDILAKVDETYFNSATGYNPGYIGAMSFQGWFTFISEPFAKFLFILMKFFYKMTSSWGISIILLTIALRVMLYPLNAWSIKSTVRMQQIAPKVAAIQEKHKKDPKRAQMEVMNLYREKGVNPLTGCFPLLIQLPFLIGMFDLLKSTFELRGAPFIPGWIDNLTSPDVLFSWDYPVIFFGTSFHLLPLLLGAVMWVQQRFSTNAPKDPKLMTDQQRQQKFMGNIMTVVFTVMFYHFPSGLNIYWLSSMALGIGQQWMMTRKMSSATIKVDDLR